MLEVQISQEFLAALSPEMPERQMAASPENLEVQRSQSTVLRAPLYSLGKNLSVLPPVNASVTSDSTQQGRGSPRKLN